MYEQTYILGHVQFILQENIESAFLKVVQLDIAENYKISECYEFYFGQEGFTVVKMCLKPNCYL